MTRHKPVSSVKFLVVSARYFEPRAVEVAVIPTQCRTADNRMSITFDATPWFSEADSGSIIQLAQQGWSSPWVADALQHRPGYEHLRELIEYATERLEKESLEDPSWSAFECVVSGPEAMAWLYEHRPDTAAKVDQAS